MQRNSFSGVVNNALSCPRPSHVLFFVYSNYHCCLWISKQPEQKESLRKHGPLVSKIFLTGSSPPKHQVMSQEQQTIRVVCYARIADRVSFHRLVHIPFRAQSWPYRVSSVEVSREGSVYVIGTIYRSSDALPPQNWHPIGRQWWLEFVSPYFHRFFLYVMCLCSSVNPTCLRNWFLPLLINRPFRQEQFVGFGPFLLPLPFCLVHNL